MRSEKMSMSGHRTIRALIVVAGIMTISLATMTVLFELEKAGLIELAEMQTRPHFQLSRPAGDARGQPSARR